MGNRITGISSMATRGLLIDVVRAWHGRDDCDVAFESVGGVDAAKRVMDGEGFDLVVLAAEAIDMLASAGRIARGSTRSLARSSVAIAVRQGAAKPDVASEAALRRTVLAARHVGYSTGPSGRALQSLFTRWGIGPTIEPRFVQAPPGVPVAELIRRGDVELGFQQLSELTGQPGVEVIGPMPAGSAIDTVFSGAVCAASRQPDAALALLDFIRSSAMDEAFVRHGMQPTR